MSPLPAGWSAAEVVSELIDPPTRAYVPFEGLEIEDRPGWARLTCAAFPRGGYNHVSRSHLAASEADAVIDATVADYARRGLTFRWSVFPDSTPQDLGQRLQARGLQGTELVAVARASAGMDAALPAGVTVEPVTEALVEASSEVMAAGWGAPVEGIRRSAQAALADPLRRQRLFLAFVDGQPAGMATAFVFPRSLFFLGGVVLPFARRRGVYRALVERRLALARAEGVDLVTCHAMALTSAPLLAKLGFSEWFRFTSWAPRTA